MSSLAELRRVLETRFPNAVLPPDRTVPQLSTGMEQLDRILPGGGLPRGRLSVWMPGIGGTAIMRSTCLLATKRGERAAWVDASGRVAPGAEWSGVIVARPRNAPQALECAEELLRSGGFGVVVRAGEGSRGSARARLCRAAREGGAALVELSPDPHMAAVRISAGASREDFHWHRNFLEELVEVESVTLKVRVAAAGWNREANITLMVKNDDRVSFLDVNLPDRRGIAAKKGAITRERQF